MSKVWMITGANRGIGLATARAAVEAGDRVIAAVRAASSFEEGTFPAAQLEIVPLDVTSQQQAHDAVAMALARFGRIDVLVNNAGYSFLGAVEECSEDEVEALFQTNVFGLLNVTRAVLPAMRDQGSGHIINMSSSATLDASAGASPYAASKAAVETLSESLAKECAPLGIKVTTIVPGHIATGFQRDSTAFAERRIDDYDATAGALCRAIASGPAMPGSDPGKLAQAVRAIVECDNPPALFLAGADAVERFERTRGRRDADVAAWRSVSVEMTAPAEKGE
jgi:NAD(P)-dependent dehydrogenase (short-subunit alcohol dehydrogenase family)